MQKKHWWQWAWVVNAHGGHFPPSKLYEGHAHFSMCHHEQRSYAIWNTLLSNVFAFTSKERVGRRILLQKPTFWVKFCPKCLHQLTNNTRFWVHWIEGMCTCWIPLCILLKDNFGYHDSWTYKLLWGLIICNGVILWLFERFYVSATLSFGVSRSLVR